ncbi:MAG: alpha/beta hydrolase [Actinobacteria bacterium]|nr:alpha/beta hydrolase [Actinomycetota bacterium]
MGPRPEALLDGVLESATVHTERFDAGGVSLAVHTWGDADPDADARPVLLSHCTGFHGVAWRPVARLLGEAGFAVWSFDFRGHGDSDVPDIEYDWLLFGDDVLAVVDHLGLGLRPDLAGVGHSKGAAALVLAEASRPGTFERLWLYEPVIFPGDPPPGPSPGNTLAEGARRRRSTFGSLDEAFENFAAKSPFNVLAPEALRAYVDHGLRQRDDGQWELKCPGEIEARMYEMGSAHEGYRRLSDLACPAMFVSGADTNAMPAAFCQPLSERAPQGEFQLAPGLGHFGPMQDPDAIAAAVVEFLGA